MEWTTFWETFNNADPHLKFNGNTKVWLSKRIP
jgi:hypothetical protein